MLRKDAGRYSLCMKGDARHSISLLSIVKINCFDIVNLKKRHLVGNSHHYSALYRHGCLNPKIVPSSIKVSALALRWLNPCMTRIICDKVLSAFKCDRILDIYLKSMCIKQIYYQKYGFQRINYNFY